MLGRTGVRFALEAVLIVAVATGAGFAHLGAWAIVGAVVVVWVATSVYEYARSHAVPRRARRVPDEVPFDHEPIETFEHVRVLPATAVVRPAPEPRIVPEPAAPAEEAVTRVEPVVVAEAPPEPEPEPDPEPEPEPEPEPPAQDQTPPSPEPSTLPVTSAPWSWNVWNLERVVRERASDNEELQFLLLYLRDYASPSGMLPPDFDGLVRESFGDLLAAPS